MSPLHDELKQRRLENGISLETIFNRTKIRIEILEKLETGDYNVAPRPYVRAFLREYAEVVGVDPQTAIDVLDGKRNSIFTTSLLSASPAAVRSDIPETTTIKKDVPNVSEKSFIVSYSQKKPSDNPAVLPVEPITVEPPEPPTIDLKEPVEEPIATIETVAETPASVSAQVTVATFSEPVDTAYNMLPAIEPVQTEMELYQPVSRKKKKKQTSQNTQPSLFVNESLAEPETPTANDFKANAEETTVPETPAVPRIIDDYIPAAVSPSIRPVADDNVGAPSEPYKRLDIDEPESGGKLFLAVFVLLIIAAAVAIVWMNRSGMF